MTMRRIQFAELLVVVLLISGALIAPARAADQPSADWTLTTADFRAERVTLKSIDAAGAHVVASDGTARTVGFDQLLQLDRNSAARNASPARLILCLAGGDRIGGEPVGVQAEVLRWR